jgi:hypothetical protein
VRTVHGAKPKGAAAPEPPARDQVRPLREMRDDDGSG